MKRNGKKKLFLLGGISILIGTFLMSNINDVKAENVTIPSQSSIKDVNLYRCALEYLHHQEDYSYVITDEDLASLTKLNCEWDESDYEYVDGKYVGGGIRFMPNQHQIRDLSGIEKMVNLKLLNLSYSINEVTSIDVSNLTKLEELSLVNSKIESINVSNNTELKKLLLNVTDIDEIDVSHNTKLEELQLNGTYIRNINLENNSELKRLFIGSLNLNSLDTSNLTKLESLGIFNSKITSLDLHNSKALNFADLMDNQELTSINIDGLTDIMTLRVDSCKKLESLDLSNLTNLQQLGISNTKINSEQLNLSSLSNLKNLKINPYGVVTFDKSYIYRNGTKIDPTSKIATGDAYKKDGNETIIVINGDTTKDGDVDMKDVLQVYNHQRNEIDSTKPTISGYAPTQAADYNSDNSIDMKDVLLIYEEQKNN